MRLIRVGREEDVLLALENAAGVLEKGGIVACPTETYYGLCARFDDENALERLHELKGRREEKPFPLIIGSLSLLPLLTEETGGLAKKLMDKFWPGPLTILLKARGGLSGHISRGGKVAVRMPGESFALELARRCRLPLTATSANISGLPPSQTAEQVLEYFDGRLDLVVDAGGAPGGLPSTIVDATCGGLKLLREGATGFEEIKSYLGI
ncbi:MAG: L-threonylcarbamoyladenylate synthase [Nitrospiraceae bacterium]|nr:L-threonylcarbamoyladenylate synthase [Nitrospiraceae bacterium]